MFSNSTRLFLCGMSTIISSACASLSSDETELENEIKNISSTEDPSEINQLEANHSMMAIPDGSKNKKNINLETCVIGEQKNHALLLFPHKLNAELQKLQCMHPVLQAFLGKGYATHYINLSEETDDFGGMKSRLLLEKSSTLLAKDGKAISALWGYEASTAAVGFVSKKISGLKFIILGNGLYDGEQVSKLSPNGNFTTFLKPLDPKMKEKAIEERSISWDYSGITKEIKIYHQEEESNYPISQAESFKDSLVAGQLNVKFQKIPPGQEWNSQKHRQVIELLLPRAI